MCQISYSSICIVFVKRGSKILLDVLIYRLSQISQFVWDRKYVLSKACMLNMLQLQCMYVADYNKGNKIRYW